MQPPYFKGLDVLRFVAAAIVVLSHVHYHLNELHVPWHDNASIMYAGRQSVWFFFVLSGFLLTRLAIREQAHRGTFNVRGFYLRRIRRIWPLYYFGLLLSFIFAFVLIPIFYPAFNVQFPVVPGLISTLLLFPNFLAANRLTNIGSINNLWSIGVEEGFYLLFPFLIVLSGKLRNYVLVFIAAGITWIFILQGVYSWWAFIAPAIRNFIFSYQLEYMLVGCLLAVAWTKKEDSRQVGQWLSIIMAVAGIVAGIIHFENFLWLFWLRHLCAAIFFAAIIWFTASVGNRPFNNNPLVYFGKISYGIYIYHPFVSYFYRFLFQRWDGFAQLAKKTPTIYFLLILFSSIAVAHFSYRYFEKWFIRKGGYRTANA
jgi:peptidoglycan/LPS O-acetylase OafA/YrhL